MYTKVDMLLCNVYQHINEHVNVKVWVSPTQRNQTENGFSCLVADKTGSLWARFLKGNELDGDNWY